jgi:uncharacterized membrane-anchored protein
MKNGARWMLVLMFHLLFFAGFTLQEEWLRRDAHTIYLETIPVDPRDYWSGQYMVLNYAIEADPRLKTPKHRPAILLAPHKTIQTSAGERSVYTLKDVRPASEVTLGSYTETGIWAVGEVRSGGIDLGIDRFYFNEERVAELSKLTPDEFLVEIIVSAQGEMRVNDLIITPKSTPTP